MADAYHKPVLLDEVIDVLALRVGGVYIDATVGGGGHSRAIAQIIGPLGTVIGVDRDREALAEATETLRGTEANFVTINAPFDEIGAGVREYGFEKVDGVLYDLGVSSHQLDDAGRGFTFREGEAPLDMRMSQHEDTPTAADILNTWSVADLTTTIRDYADERWAARIAQFVAERRESVRFETASQLIETVKAAIPAAARSKDIHPATKTFQALRIAVNDEYGRLQRSLVSSVDLLKESGRLVVISYHSGEDRIVKQTIAELAGKCICPPEVPSCICRAQSMSLKIITKKPLLPSTGEISSNPRARSAKLRAASKI